MTSFIDIDGKKLCKIHAAYEALHLAVKAGTAKPLPGGVQEYAPVRTTIGK